MVPSARPPGMVAIRAGVGAEFARPERGQEYAWIKRKSGFGGWSAMR